MRVNFPIPEDHTKFLSTVIGYQADGTRSGLKLQRNFEECGVVDGILLRVDRLNALGNAVVIQIAIEFFKVIIQIEEFFNN